MSQQQQFRADLTKLRNIKDYTLQIHQKWKELIDQLTNKKTEFDDLERTYNYKNATNQQKVHLILIYFLLDSDNNDINDGRKLLVRFINKKITNIYNDEDIDSVTLKTMT